MKYYYVLNKVTKTPAGGYIKVFAREISITKLKFTSNKLNAKKLRFIYAMFYSFFFGLSTIQCLKNDGSIGSKNTETQLNTGKDYNKN